jgi:hypothetical protein
LKKTQETLSGHHTTTKLFELEGEEIGEDLNRIDFDNLEALVKAESV